MPEIVTQTLPNGLAVHRIAARGDARRDDARRLRRRRPHRAPRGERDGPLPRAPRVQGRREVPDYRDVNETAERIGAVLNAYTSHDLVAFHITARAERGARGRRPADRLRRAGRSIDADELDRERGVVIQEIARADDQPSVVAEHLIDRAAFGDHPLGRPVLGPAEHLRTFTRDGDRRLPRAALVGPPRRRVPRRQPRRAARERRAGRAVRPLPRPARAAGVRARAAVRARDARSSERDSNQSHLRMSYRPRGRRRATRPSARRWRSTRRCSAARWARACSTRSASSAASPTRSHALAHAFADVADPAALGRPGLDQERRGLHAHARDRRPSCATTARPRPRSSAPAPTPPARRVLAFENTGAVARYAAQQAIVYGEEIDPDAAIAAARRGDLRRGRRGRARRRRQAAVAVRRARTTRRGVRL